MASLSLSLGIGLKNGDFVIYIPALLAPGTQAELGLPPYTLVPSPHVLMGRRAGDEGAEASFDCACISELGYIPIGLHADQSVGFNSELNLIQGSTASRYLSSTLQA